MDQQRIVSVLAWACLSLLGACGGGGGGGDDAPGIPPPPVAPAPPNLPPAESSLIPEAGPLGAVLYADAAPLRVLRAGALWSYRGLDQTGGAPPSDNITYANKVSLTGSDAQGYVEQGTNVFNEGIDQTEGLRFDMGAYTASLIAEVSENGPRVAETVAELRSPVRVNDLYGTFERRNVDIGTDLDGDRVNETASIAMYSRVVDRESVDLPNRRGVEAVRVDTTMRVRVTPSATRVALPVYEAVQSSWYAPGVGVVKRRLEEPNATTGRPNRVVTEVLENWDGVSEGLGHLPTGVAAAPASSPLAGSALQFPFDAVGFDTHAVVAAYLPERPTALGIVLAQLDPRGAVLAARSYAMGELFPGAPWVFQPRLVRSADELRLFAQLGNGAIGMLALDATGQRILRPPVTLVTDSALTLDYDRVGYHVVADGTGFWLAWQRSVQDADGRYLRSALAGRFGADGQAQGAPLLVMEPVAADIHNVSMAIDGNRVGLSWYETNLQFVRRLVTIDTGSMALSRSTLDLPTETCFSANMISLQPGLAITCWMNNSSPVSAARLDAKGQIMLANGGSLAGEAFKAPWLAPANGGALGAGGAGELYVAARQYAPYWPGDTAEVFTTVLRTNSAGGALASNEPLLLARLRESPGNVMSVLQLGNRLLLLGSGQNGYLTTTVVWLPK